MRKTKIICTIGPATDTYDMILKLFARSALHAAMRRL